MSQDLARRNYIIRLQTEGLASIDTRLLEASTGAFVGDELVFWEHIWRAVEAGRWDLVDVATSAVLQQKWLIDNYELDYLALARAWDEGRTTDVLYLADLVINPSSGSQADYANKRHLQLYASVYKWRALVTTGRPVAAVKVAQRALQRPGDRGTKWAMMFQKWLDTQ